MDFDAIVPLSGGTVQDRNGIWRSTTYEERDLFGSLGGILRVQAAAILAKKHEKAFVVTTNRRTPPDPGPTHASIHAHELVELGVPRDRIILEENSLTTRDKIIELTKLCKEHNWKTIAIVTSEYHIPRTRLLWEQHGAPDVTVEFIVAEDVIIAQQPEFKAEFEKIKQTPAYHTRLESETRGIEALKSGMYQEASLAEKLERKT